MGIVDQYGNPITSAPGHLKGLERNWAGVDRDTPVDIASSGNAEIDLTFFQKRDVILMAVPSIKDGSEHWVHHRKPKQKTDNIVAAMIHDSQARPDICACSPGDFYRFKAEIERNGGAVIDDYVCPKTGMSWRTLPPGEPINPPEPAVDLTPLYVDEIPELELPQEVADAIVEAATHWAWDLNESRFSVLELNAEGDALRIERQQTEAEQHEAEEWMAEFGDRHFGQLYIFDSLKRRLIA